MAKGVSGIILFAQTGRMPAGLKVLLKSLFPLTVIEQTEDPNILKELLNTNSPWLVLIDVALPAGQGWIAAREIQQRFSLHHPILLTHQLRESAQAETAGLQALLLEDMTADSLSDTLAPFLQS